MLNDHKNDKDDKEMLIKNNKTLKNEIDELKKQLNAMKLVNQRLAKELEEVKIKYKNLEENIRIKELEREKCQKSSNNLLNQKIIEKDNKIEELKNKIENYPYKLNKGEELISVIISSFDESIQHTIICKNTDVFYKIEKEFYDNYNEFSKSDNSFYVNKSKINKIKSMKDNNINNHDVIIAHLKNKQSNQNK